MLCINPRTPLSPNCPHKCFRTNIASPSAVSPPPVWPLWPRPLSPGLSALIDGSWWGNAQPRGNEKYPSRMDSQSSNSYLGDSHHPEEIHQLYFIAIFSTLYFISIPLFRKCLNYTPHPPVPHCLRAAAQEARQRGRSLDLRHTPKKPICRSWHPHNNRCPKGKWVKKTSSLFYQRSKRRKRNGWETLKLFGARSARLGLQEMGSLELGRPAFGSSQARFWSCQTNMLMVRGQNTETDGKCTGQRWRFSFPTPPLDLFWERRWALTQLWVSTSPVVRQPHFLTEVTGWDQWFQSS